MAKITAMKAASRYFREYGFIAEDEDASVLVGKTFSFEHNDHLVCGRIESVGYGPEEGVSIRVTSPRMFGCNVKLIKPTDTGRARIEYTEGEGHSGALTIH